MPIKITEVVGKIRSDGNEIKFSTLSELIEMIENKVVSMPEFIFVYGVDEQKKTYQMVMDFNSFSRQDIDINSLRTKKYQKYLGDMLVEKKIITQEKLDAALKIKEASSHSERLGEILVRLGYVTSNQILESLNEQIGVAR